MSASYVLGCPAKRHDSQVRLAGFLASEFTRKDMQACWDVDLMFSPGDGHLDEQVREWSRADYPNLFEPTKAGMLVSAMMDIAEGEVDSKPPGRYRFFIRTRQYMGGRQVCSFAIHHSGNLELPVGSDSFSFADCLGWIDVAIDRALRHPDVNHDDISRRLKTGLSGLPKQTRKVPR